MSDTRFQLVELKLTEHDRLHEEHNRRLADHAAIMKGHAELLGAHAEQIKAQSGLIAALQKSTVTQEKMIEVGENLLVALGWVGRFAKWIGALAGACVAIKAFFVGILHIGRL